MAGYGCACAAHAVGGVADRAGEAIVKVASMFGAVESYDDRIRQDRRVQRAAQLIPFRNDFESVKAKACSLASLLVLL